MIRDKVKNYTKGWFLGNFTPSLINSSNFELGYKEYKKGDVEVSHKQQIAQEVTLIIEGTARMGSEYLNAGDIILIEPQEFFDFEALSDVKLVCFKTPSSPNDKVQFNE